MFFCLWIRSQWAKIAAEGLREVESGRVVVEEKSLGFPAPWFFCFLFRDVAKPAQPQYATVCHSPVPLATTETPSPTGMSKWIDPVPDESLDCYSDEEVHMAIITQEGTGFRLLYMNPSI